MMVQMTNIAPVVEGTYMMQLPKRNTRLADLKMVGGGLMVYCLDVNIHQWVDRLPPGIMWSIERFDIQGDSRMN